MRSKIIKNIHIFSLWLAWLVITAHLVVPHDHHLADSLTHKEDTCPVSDGKTGHSSGFPVNCHAFNDLASERATTFVLKENIQSNDISFTGHFNDRVVELHVLRIKIHDHENHLPDPFLLEISSLRAPPSLV